MTMSTGEVDFDGVFRLSPSGESGGADELFFPAISYIVWILFIFFMPVVLINMLVSPFRGTRTYQSQTLQPIKIFKHILFPFFYAFLTR